MQFNIPTIRGGLLRLFALLLLLPLLTGTSNSSNSTYVADFPANPVPSDSLLMVAVSSLEQSGFSRIGNCCSDAGIELQYGQQPLWVDITSPLPGRLQLAFRQTQGGCNKIQEVAGARDAMEQVRTSLELRYGQAQISVYHAANQEPQVGKAVQ